MLIKIWKANDTKSRQNLEGQSSFTVYSKTKSSLPTLNYNAPIYNNLILQLFHNNKGKNQTDIEERKQVHGALNYTKQMQHNPLCINNKV